MENQTTRAVLVGLTLTTRTYDGKRGKNVRVFGVLHAADARTVTIGMTVYPTGPWDKWEAHEKLVTVDRSRIVRRSSDVVPASYPDAVAS